MSDELKMGYGRFDEVKSHPLISGPLATLDERNAATIADLRTKLAEARLERDVEAADDLATLRTQLAAMTAGRDALQTSMNELRKTCAEIIGADPQTWPDHGNAPLAIAACLGLRDAELQKTTAERDAALAKVAVLRDQMEKFDQWSQAYPTDVFPELDLPLAHELLKAGGMSLDRLSAGAMRHTISRVGELARNALEATK